MDDFKPKEVDVTDSILPFKEPRLTPDERLYVESYFISFSHAKAHESISPGHKKYQNKNTYSKRESVQYHINKKTIKKASAIALESDTIMDLLLQEATRLGNGSSPTARVQALQLLGKQLGLFEEKKDEKEAITFNLVSYGSAEVLKVEKVEEKVIESEPLETPGISIEVQTFDENKG